VTAEVVTITGIAAGGDGVGRLSDGRAVFVPRTAPGERVRLRGDAMRVRKNFARGMVEEILAPVGERVTPPCPHYTMDRCGGCQLQHLGYDAQLAAKRRLVGDALRRIGKLDVGDPEITEAVEEWRYRGEITLSVKRAGGARIIGLQAYDRTGSVFQLADCHITDYALMALWRDLRSHLELLPDRLTRLTLRLTPDGYRHLIAESPGEPWSTAPALRTALPNGETLVCWWQAADDVPPPRPPARVVAGTAEALALPALDRKNREMASVARRWAVDQIGDVRGQIAWDLYAGGGDAAALLAARGATVVSVDVDEQAIAVARKKHGAAGRFVAGRVEEILPTLSAPYAAVLAPPATGLHWGVTLGLTAAPVPRLAYLSSDPATLSRDLNRLSATYRLTDVRAFDLLPQTAAVAAVAILEAA
jgi:23S rRNA (uracil1939-C5)-methyltransferase